ncbi:MAG TPA: aldehyde dehydrogenase family protein [Candidatus Binatia bacterium]|nr:aldehyde dehydrogenase family protein [Candidatus Binatia bacterium]
MVATPVSDRAARPKATDLDDLDIAAQLAKEMSPRFARLSPEERAALLRELIPSTAAAAEGWVRAACEAKRIPFDAPVSGEEWLAGPAVVVRNLRLLAESWERIAAGRSPIDGLPVRRRDGLAEVDVFPAGPYDGLLFAGFRATVIARDSEALAGPDAPSGGCCLILGAGNVSSIPAMDALYKLFVEGKTCVLKMNPVNDWAGPFIERAFAALVSRGFLEVVYGGAEAGEFLCRHPAIDEVHITGSDRTHDLIVWGPPGPERDRRKAANDPVLRKPVTSELGNVSPVAIVPGPYTERQLGFMARNVAGMVTNNASFNCNAAKMLVTAKGWPQRDRFQFLLTQALAATATRDAYYPGAFDRYDALLKGRHAGVVTVGTRKDGKLPWTLVEGLDPSDTKEPLFRTEPFCGILGETIVASTDPEDFLWTMTLFCNHRLWGTLNASVIVHPETEKRHQAALERAIAELDYGTVAVNHWPALGYGFVSPPWGGAPGATLADVKSGIGWVHNTFMLRDVVKSVIRGPLTVSPKPAWFADNRRCHEIGRKLVAFEASPSWTRLPGIIASAVRG